MDAALVHGERVVQVRFMMEMSATLLSFLGTGKVAFVHLHSRPHLGNVYPINEDRSHARIPMPDPIPHTAPSRSGGPILVTGMRHAC